MARQTKSQEKALERLEKGREFFEEHLQQVERALESEFGWAPRLKVWAVPILGFAAGVTAALWLASPRRRKG